MNITRVSKQWKIVNTHFGKKLQNDPRSKRKQKLLFDTYKRAVEVGLNGINDK